MTRSLGTVFESFQCGFGFTLSHTYLHLYSNLAEKERNGMACLPLKKLYQVIIFGP